MDLKSTNGIDYLKFGDHFKLFEKIIQFDFANHQKYHGKNCIIVNECAYE